MTYDPDCGFKAEWKRMMRFWGIDDTNWPFDGVRDWKQKLRTTPNA